MAGSSPVGAVNSVCRLHHELYWGVDLSSHMTCLGPVWQQPHTRMYPLCVLMSLFEGRSPHSGRARPPLQHYSGGCPPPPSHHHTHSIPPPPHVLCLRRLSPRTFAASWQRMPGWMHSDCTHSLPTTLLFMHRLSPRTFAAFWLSVPATSTSSRRMCNPPPPRPPLQVVSKDIRRISAERVRLLQFYPGGCVPALPQHKHFEHTHTHTPCACVHACTGCLQGRSPHSGRARPPLQHYSGGCPPPTTTTTTTTTTTHTQYPPPPHVLCLRRLSPRTFAASWQSMPGWMHSDCTHSLPTTLLFMHRLAGSKDIRRILAERARYFNIITKVV
jgi:hypothetical protein